MQFHAIPSVTPLYGKAGMDVSSLRVLRLEYQMHVYTKKQDLHRHFWRTYSFV